ncbi:MAG TPA: SDR family NAD(P)-dependent oxidoreductase [Thermoanaerobaculia bacterium]|nr:SDR family NAD(P)-dependent oxidoreductase [Thermoanaerobaculia bacterium]
MNRTVLVTGGNRGLGLATARALAAQGYSVILTARDRAKAEAAAAGIAGARAEVLDVADAESIDALRARVPAVDILINNAAVALDEGIGVLDVERDLVRTTLQTNLHGPLLLCQAYVPGMRQRRWGRVVNVSSGAGQLSTMTDYAPSYSISKAALNALTRQVAAAAKGSGVLVNSVCPGWVRTDMGGPNAARSIDEGIETIVWAATLPDNGPTGGFFRDRKLIPW